MGWHEWLVAGVGAVYACIAVGYGLDGRLGLALTFSAYAAANAGLILVACGR